MSVQARSVLIFGGAGFIGSNLAHHLLTKTQAMAQRNGGKIWTASDYVGGRPQQQTG